MSSDVRSTILSELFSTDIGKVKSAGRKTNENANKYDWEKLTTLFKNISDNTSSGKVVVICISYMVVICVLKYNMILVCF